MATIIITTIPNAGFSIQKDNQSIYNFLRLAKWWSVPLTGNISLIENIIAADTYTFNFSDTIIADSTPVTGTFPQIVKYLGDTYFNAAINDAGENGSSGYSGNSGHSGYSGNSGHSGVSGYSGIEISGYSGYSGSGVSGYSGYSGLGLSGYSGFSGQSGYSGYSGSGISGYSGYSGSGISGYSGYSGGSGYSGFSGLSGYSGYSGKSGYSGNPGASITKGSFSQVGTATTTFTVTFGGTQPNNIYQVAVTPTDALSAAFFYVNNKSTTTFDVVYLAGLTGTVQFDWELFN